MPDTSDRPEPARLKDPARVALGALMNMLGGDVDRMIAGPEITPGGSVPGGWVYGVVWDEVRDFGPSRRYVRVTVERR